MDNKRGYDINRGNTLIILDWDDTLFPTDWALKNGIDLTQASARDQYVVYFQELDRVLSRLLTKLAKYGNVVIITNALPEWVKISSIVLPNTFAILRKTKIISARAKYCDMTENVMHWKELAFKSEIKNEFKHKKFLNIISIGDADYEYKALISLDSWDHSLQNKNDQANKVSTRKILKSIRFMKNPSHDILVDQLEVLIHAIPEISNKNDHLDLKFDQFSRSRTK